MAYSYGGGFLLQGAYFALLAATLGAADFGVFAASLAFANVLAAFVGVGAGNVMVRRTAREPAYFAEQFGTCLTYLTGSFLLVAPLVFIAARTLAASLVPIVLLLCLSELLFLRIFEISLQAFQAHDRLHLTAHLNIGASMTRVAAVAIFTWSGLEGVRSWTQLYVSATAVIAVACLMTVFVQCGRPRLTQRSLRTTWRLGVPYAIGSASKTVYGDVDKIVLQQNGESAIAGAYTAAYRLTSMAFVPAQAVVYASNTQMFRAGASGAQASAVLMRRLAPVVLAPALAGAIGLLLLAPLLPAVLGQDYSRSVPMLIGLAFLPLVQGVHYLIGDTLMGLGRQGSRSALQGVVAALNVGANLVLIPLYGWQGAVAATYLSESVLVLGFAYLFRREWERMTR